MKISATMPKARKAKPSKRQSTPKDRLQLALIMRWSMHADNSWRPCKRLGSLIWTVLCIFYIFLYLFISEGRVHINILIYNRRAAALGSKPIKHACSDLLTCWPLVSAIFQWKLRPPWRQHWNHKCLSQRRCQKSRLIRDFTFFHNDKNVDS